MSKYIWCEDKSAGFQFWTELFKTICPEAIVETQNNNTELRKAVGKITDEKSEYYILMDEAVDNLDVLRELKKIKEIIDGKNNVKLVDIHSFEYVLLSFELLEDWIFAHDDDLQIKREQYLEDRKKLIRILGGAIITDEEQTDFAKLLDTYGKRNSEQLVACLLEEITKNTGFATNKKSLGCCFVNSCCEWQERAGDDICGLDENRLSSDEKKRTIVEYSVLKQAFEKAGL